MTKMQTTREKLPVDTQNGITGPPLTEMIDTHLHMPFPFASNPHEPEK